jgi:hypothetical protein
VKNWRKRQYKSDISTGRVKRFRERSRNVSETHSDTDTDTDTDTDKKTKQKKKVVVEILPDWVPQADWEDFKAHRKAIRKPVTMAVTKRAINDLEKLKIQGEDVSAVINQSIVNGWAGFFAIKQQKQFNGQSKQASVQNKSLDNINNFFKNRGVNNE